MNLIGIRKLIKKFKSINYSMIDQAIVSCSNFLCSLIIVKLIGLNEFGLFSTFWLILLFISSISVSIIISPMMAIVPQRSNTIKYFGSLFIFQSAFSVGGFLFSFFLCLLYSIFSEFSISIKTVFCFSLCVLFHHFQEFFRKYFFANKQFINAILVDSITYLLRVCLLLSLMGYQVTVDLDIVFLVYLATSFLGCLFGFYSYEFKITPIDVKQDYLAHIAISKWLIPSGLLKWTSVNLFLVTSSILLGPASLGIIKLSQNIVAVYNLFLLGLDNFIPLESAKIYVKDGIDGLISYMRKIAVYGLAFTVVFGGLLILFSNKIIGLFYGASFVKYSTILYWFSSFLVFIFLNSLINIFLITINKTKITFKGYIYTSVFSLVIFYPLIHFFNITGVLIGILCSHSFLLITFKRLIKKNIHLWS